MRQQLRKRIRLWSDNIKKPTFIRSRDKIGFSIGVANACFSPLIGKRLSYSAFDEFNLIRLVFSFKIKTQLCIAGRWPHLLPIVYTVQTILLLTSRFFIYKSKSWHYFSKPTKNLSLIWRIQFFI